MKSEWKIEQDPNGQAHLIDGEGTIRASMLVQEWRSLLADVPPVAVDKVIQFVYSTDGIKNLSEMCYPDIVLVGKDRHPTAKAWAEIRTRNFTYIAHENDIIKKNSITGYTIESSV